MSIADIAKNMCIKHNVTFRVIDKGTNQVVREYSGHNQATNTMLSGVGHYLACGGTERMVRSLLAAYIPKFISLGTMGLVNQDEDENHLPLGICGYDVDESADDATKYTAYMNQAPGYGADGYSAGMNNDRPEFGLGAAYDPETGAVGCELVTPTFLRVPITHQEVIPETNAEYPETVDVVLSAMISTGALAQFRGDNDYVFISEAGLWSKQKNFDSQTSNFGSGFLAGYRIKPPSDINWDMSYSENRTILQQNIIRVGINQVVQVIWKIQIGSVKRLDISSNDTELLSKVISKSSTLRSIVIPNGTDAVGAFTFSGCSNLESVSLPSTVKTINNGAFSSCQSLKFLVLNDGLEEINAWAFDNCQNLTQLTIPSTVYYIADGEGSSAFENCTALTTIYVNKPQGSIAGAPWGAVNAEVIWRG